MKVLLFSIGLVVVAATGASGQPAPAKIDVTALGPQVGERIPDFRVSDQNGTVDARYAGGPEWHGPQHAPPVALSAITYPGSPVELPEVAVV